MSVRQKRGKGRYAYQAKKFGQQVERPAVDNQAVSSNAEKYGREATNTIEANTIVRNGNNSVVMPVNIGKIDLIYEIKRIAIIAAVVIALLIILFIVLK
jgi:hypothetical protein